MWLREPRSLRRKKTTMKKRIKLFLFFSAIFLFWSLSEVEAQNISINGTGATAHPSAILDVSSPNMGLLIPRIPLTAINASAPVTSPTVSLLVYNTASASTGTNAVSPGYYYWDGIQWVRFAYNASGSFGDAWTTLGNVGTNPITNFLGTTDAQDLVFRTNNLEAVRVTTLGNVGIGSSNPQNKITIGANNGSGYAISANNPTPYGINLITSEVVSSNNAALWMRTTTNSGITYNDLFRVQNDGNVGIGTQTLNVSGSTTNANILTISGKASGAGQASNGRIELANSIPSASLTPNLTTAGWLMGCVNNNGAGVGSADPVIGVMRFVLDGAGGASGYGGKITFATKQDNNVLSDKMYLLHNGNLGLGAATPANKLEITQGTAGNSGLRFTNLPNAGILSTNASGDVITATASTATNNGVFWGLLGNSGTNSSTNFIGTTDNVPLVFRTNNVEKMRMLANGNVGLYTTTPIACLEIATNTLQLAAPGLKISSSYNGNYVASTIVLQSDADWSHSGGIFYLNTTATNKKEWYAGVPYAAQGFGIGLRKNVTNHVQNDNSSADLAFNKFYIDTTGNVGIGTIVPAARLEIQGFRPTAESGVLSTPAWSATTGGWSYDSYPTVVGAGTADVAGYNQNGGQMNSANVTNFASFQANQWPLSFSAASNGYGFRAKVLSGVNRWAFYADQAQSYFGGNVGIGITVPDSRLTVEGGDIRLGEGTLPNVGKGRSLLFSNSGNNTDIVEIYRENVGLDLTNLNVAVGDNAYSGLVNDKFNVGGYSSGSFSAALTVDVSQVRVGIGTPAPSEKLEVQGSVKIVDGTQGSGKVLTSDATGKATWQVSSGSLLSTQNIPVQSIPPTATTPLAGFLFSAPSASDYRVEFRNWCTFTGGTVGADIAFHVRVLKNGVAVDEFEQYTVLGPTRNVTFNVILHVANCNVGDNITIDLRPGIAAGATSIDFNSSNGWTTSKVLVFPE